MNEAWTDGISEFRPRLGMGTVSVFPDQALDLDYDYNFSLIPTPKVSLFCYSNGNQNWKHNYVQLWIQLE